ncbi:MAG TPA: hypothetical protein PKV16_04775 [Caldisericia bacterium]|nr:hypothetical protein [Caldisericia bacterium]HPF48625.1 hypothetical protein [Caldisericia bacterium]HPI83715.1 hypothetical protein [Caldisericia bacterium]HPQ93080.1 hypothetical protein [Caldisericia bacterium]HRV75087.1 hypothetical protein [Caldisericia bacterium]
MRGQEIVAWAQCRQASGAIKDFCGWMVEHTDNSLTGGVQQVTNWVNTTKMMVESSADELVNIALTGQPSSENAYEYIPVPSIYGDTTLNQQWERIIQVAGMVWVYGISISAIPDPAAPPIPPSGVPTVMGSVVVKNAIWEPANPLYNLEDIPSPRFDFTHTCWYGLSDKPVTPLATPYELTQDIYSSPQQLEPNTWNVNIPIARHRVPNKGLSIWTYWNSMTPPKLRVKLITAPKVT